MLKKAIIICAIIQINLVAENLNLTGEYAKEITNPFSFLEKKNKVYIVNNEKDYILPVVDNLKKTNWDITNIRKYIDIKEFIISNESVNRIVEIFLKDKNINAKKIEINIIEGIIDLEYSDFDERNTIEVLKNIKLFLTVQLIIDGKESIEKIEMDKKLANNNVDLKGVLTTEDFKLFSIKDINRIMEYSIFKVLQKI
ncbi:MAG: hypothetical protein RBT22_10170 [Aliarcobacter sp.]|jgi:hypothetical protein|nr:hypothetical protein [Aliarcobacter sp.]